MKKVIILTTDGEAQTYENMRDYLEMTVSSTENELDELVAFIEYNEGDLKAISVDKVHQIVMEYMAEEQAANSDYDEHNTHWGL